MPFWTSLHCSGLKFRNLLHFLLHKLRRDTFNYFYNRIKWTNGPFAECHCPSPPGEHGRKYLNFKITLWHLKLSHQTENITKAMKNKSLIHTYIQTCIYVCMWACVDVSVVANSLSHFRPANFIEIPNPPPHFAARSPGHKWIFKLNRRMIEWVNEPMIELCNVRRVAAGRAAGYNSVEENVDCHFGKKACAWKTCENITFS